MTETALITGALCSKEQVLDYGKFEGGINSNLINRLINGVTKYFQNYCGVVSFLQATYSDERHDGYGDCELFPYFKPIISVTSLYDDTSRAFTSDTLISSSNYEIIDNEYILLKPGYIFSESKGNVKITYSAGYTSIPDDLEQAAIAEVSRLYRRKDSNDINSQTDADTTKTFIVDAILPQTKSILSRYRKRVIS